MDVYAPRTIFSELAFLEMIMWELSDCFEVSLCSREELSELGNDQGSVIKGKGLR